MLKQLSDVLGSLDESVSQSLIANVVVEVGLSSLEDLDLVGGEIVLGHLWELFESLQEVFGDVYVKSFVSGSQVFLLEVALDFEGYTEMIWVKSLGKHSNLIIHLINKLLRLSSLLKNNSSLLDLLVLLGLNLGKTVNGKIWNIWLKSLLGHLLDLSFNIDLRHSLGGGRGIDLSLEVLFLLLSLLLIHKIINLSLLINN